MDLDTPFNSCTVLIYHSLSGIKTDSRMGWHCDSKFSLAGNFKLKSNGQTYNTPIVIFTIGKVDYYIGKGGILKEALLIIVIGR